MTRFKTTFFEAWIFQFSNDICAILETFLEKNQVKDFIFFDTKKSWMSEEIIHETY